MSEVAKAETTVILKNPPEPKAALAEIPHQEAKPPEIPAGTVPRDLTFGDRKLILDISRLYCQEKDKGTAKNLVKASRLEKLLDKDSVEEYFDAQQDDLDEARTKHTDDMVKWAKYQNWKNSVEPRCETCREKLKPPSDDCVIEKPVKLETVDHEKARGPSSRFFILKKVDDWVIQAIKALTNFNAAIASEIDELCRKFGITDED